MKERGDRATLQLPPDDYIAFRVDAMNLKNCLPDVETDCRDRLHTWLLRIVGASTAPTSMALTCRWRSRPQHHKRISAPSRRRHFLGSSVAASVAPLLRLVSSARRLDGADVGEL